MVIGNSAYRDAPLTDPANDAKAVGGLFAQAGFTVSSHLDATRSDMMAAIERFGAAAKRPETKLVVFDYAGHGAQLDWRNYLLPVDAMVETQEHMKQRCVDLSLLLGQLSAAKDKTFVIILDACRTTPSAPLTCQSRRVCRSSMPRLAACWLMPPRRAMSPPTAKVQMASTLRTWCANWASATPVSRTH